MCLNAQFPVFPVRAWMLVNAGLTTLVDIIGLTLTDRLNKLLTGLAVFLVLLLVAHCLVHPGQQPPKSYTEPLWNADSSPAAIPAAAAIAAYSHLGFTAVNACVIIYFARNRGTGGVKVLGHVVAPALGACVTICPLTQLSATAILIGGCWLVLGFVHLLRLTRGFRRPTPELSMSDGPAETAGDRPERVVET
ncbi:hypothetical protein ACFVH0_34450 [Streptomyces sp. NPDC127117]|uniref:hypothetical protein n=1 Tax=Streptomyces sp. NPDC127117 TaxID=3345368 RepID=UPI00362C5D0B